MHFSISKSARIIISASTLYSTEVDHATLFREQCDLDAADKTLLARTMLS
jgi:hypothetical protein